MQRAASSEQGARSKARSKEQEAKQGARSKEQGAASKEQGARSKQQGAASSEQGARQGAPLTLAPDGQAEDDAGSGASHPAEWKRVAAQSEDQHADREETVRQPAEDQRPVRMRGREGCSMRDCQRPARRKRCCWWEGTRCRSYAARCVALALPCIACALRRCALARGASHFGESSTASSSITTLSGKYLRKAAPILRLCSGLVIRFAHGSSMTRCG